MKQTHPPERREGGSLDAIVGSVEVGRFSPKFLRPSGSRSEPEGVKSGSGLAGIPASRASGKTARERTE